MCTEQNRKIPTYELVKCASCDFEHYRPIKKVEVWADKLCKRCLKEWKYQQEKNDKITEDYLNETGKPRL